MPFLEEQEVEILFKTHSHIQSKEILTRYDLNQVFLTQFNEVLYEQEYIEREKHESTMLREYGKLGRQRL